MSGASGTTRFLHDGGDLVAEYDTAGNMLRRYVHGTGGGDDPQVWFEGASVADSARRYLFADERGSVVAVTDGNGNALAINRYDEYGIPGAGNAGRFQYTGQAWLPELGMYYYKARMYSPTLGRFMQTDPIGYADGMNWYAYVGNDPVNFTDPLGLRACTAAELAEITNGGSIIVCGDRPKSSKKLSQAGGGGGFSHRNLPDSGVSSNPGFSTAEGGGGPPQNGPCGVSPDGALNIVRGGLEWLSLGADGLSIAATATGVGAPIGGLVKGLQVGLEVGIAGINLYDASQNGNFAPALGQAAGRVAVALVPGARIGNRLRSSAALNWGTHANGRLRSGFHHKIAAQNQAIDTATGRAVGTASQAVGCVIQ